MAKGYKRTRRNALSSFMRLPVELQADIFHRLRTTSLLTCKRVCKAFRTVIVNPDFEGNHIRRAFTTNDISESLILELIDQGGWRKIGDTTHVLVLIDTITKDVIYAKRLTPRIPYIGKLFLVGSCNGLVCFAVRTNNTCRDDIFLLWNPVTEQSRYVPVPSIKGYSHCCLAMEFYFVPETNDYHILSVQFRQFILTDVRVAVYSMRTDCWKIVSRRDKFNLINFGFGGFDHRDQKPKTTVFLNGSFHWIFSSTECSYIVSFNLKDEKLSRTTIRRELVKRLVLYDPPLKVTYDIVDKDEYKES